MLETPRLVLREPRDDDAALLTEYYRRNEPRFAPWDPERSDDVAHYRRWAQTRRSESAAGSGRSFLAFDRRRTGVLVASVNLFEIKASPVFAGLLGYGLDGAYEAQGFAFEAVGAVLEHAFAVLPLHRIVANHEPGNTRSAALLRRLGFLVEGYQRDGIYLRGRWRDLVVTARCNPHWTPGEGLPGAVR